MVLPKRGSQVLDQLKSSHLDFVSAKFPEAVSNRPASYIHIKPVIPSDSDNKSDDSQDEPSSDDESATGGNGSKSKETEESDYEESEFEDAVDLSAPLPKKKKKTVKAPAKTVKTVPETPSSEENDNSTSGEDNSNDSATATTDANSSSEEEEAEGKKKSTPSAFSSTATLVHKSGETDDEASEHKQNGTALNTFEHRIDNFEYTTQKDKILARIKKEDEYFRNVNKKYTFTEPHSDPKDRGSRAETSRIIKSYPKNMSAPRGLVNNGVTCYMNSAVQALIHVPAMARYLSDVHKGVYRDTVSARSVTRDLAFLYNRMTDAANTRRSISPKALIKRLDDINPLMSEWNQEDAHEYFMSLVGRLQEDSVPKGQKLKSSILHEMFGGTFLQTVICQECKNKSETHQDFFDIQVSIDKHELKVMGKSTLRGSLRQYFDTSHIKKTRTEGYDCEKCKKKTSAATIQRIEEAPEYLIVSIKRYEYTSNRNSSQKIKQHLAIAPTIELTQYAVHEEPMRYQLVAFTCHEGRSASSGHYVAYCLQHDKTWALYDDDYVRQLSANQVYRSKDDVYFLIYTRVRAVPKSGASTEEVPRPVSSPNEVKEEVEDEAESDSDSEPATATLKAKKPEDSDEEVSDAETMASKSSSNSHAPFGTLDLSSSSSSTSSISRTFSGLSTSSSSISPKARRFMLARKNSLDSHHGSGVKHSGKVVKKYGKSHLRMRNGYGIDSMAPINNLKKSKSVPLIHKPMRKDDLDSASLYSAGNSTENSPPAAKGALHKLAEKLKFNKSKKRVSPQSSNGSLKVAGADSPGSRGSDSSQKKRRLDRDIDDIFSRH